MEQATPPATVTNADRRATLVARRQQLIQQVAFYRGELEKTDTAIKNIDGALQLLEEIDPQVIQLPSTPLEVDSKTGQPVNRATRRQAARKR